MTNPILTYRPVEQRKGYIGWGLPYPMRAPEGIGRAAEPGVQSCPGRVFICWSIRGRRVASRRPREVLVYCRRQTRLIRVTVVVERGYRRLGVNSPVGHYYYLIQF